MDVGLYGWVSTSVHPVIVPRYTVHERAFVFQVNFILWKRGTIIEGLFAFFLKR